MRADGADNPPEPSDDAPFQDEFVVSDDLEAVVEDVPASSVATTTAISAAPDDDVAEDVSIDEAALVRSDLGEPEWEDDLLGDFRLCGPSALFDQAEESVRVAFMQVRGDGPPPAIRQLTSVVLAYPTADEARTAMFADLDRTDDCEGTSTLPSGATYDTTTREGIIVPGLACRTVVASTILELRNPEEDTPYIGQRRDFTQCGRFIAFTGYLVTDTDDGFEHPDVDRAETIVTERFVELVQEN